jgi:cytochrome bd-type quinol oxidase subunit 1
MNISNYFEKPQLIEPGIKYFINESLKQCHNIKNTYYNFVFNVGMLLLFLIILGLILVYKYKGKLTPHEKRENEIVKQNYILSKIKTYEISKKKARDELITGLPSW